MGEQADQSRDGDSLCGKTDEGEKIPYEGGLKKGKHAAIKKGESLEGGKVSHRCVRGRKGVPGC